MISRLLKNRKDFFTMLSDLKNHRTVSPFPPVTKVTGFHGGAM